MRPWGLDRIPGWIAEVGGHGRRCAHQRLSSQLWFALSAVAPTGFEVLEAINVRVAPGRILIPDLAVVNTPGVKRTVAEPADVALVV
jgi:hypothetical protein